MDSKWDCLWRELRNPGWCNLVACLVSGICHLWAYYTCFTVLAFSSHRFLSTIKSADFDLQIFILLRIQALAKPTSLAASTYLPPPAWEKLLILAEAQRSYFSIIPHALWKSLPLASFWIAFLKLLEIGWHYFSSLFEWFCWSISIFHI